MYLDYTKNMQHFMELLMKDSQRYSPIIEFLDNVSLNLSELSWPQCEAIATEISRENKSPFCIGLHQSISKALEDLTPDEKDFDVVLKFAKKLNKDASAINLSDVQRLKNAGWSDQTIEDIVALVAIINVFNLIATGLGFKAIPKEGFTQMGEATVQNNGNLSVFKAFLQVP